MKIVVVVDAQYDFINGALRNEEAIAAVPRIVDYLKNNVNKDDIVLFTQDTHGEDYLNTQEGRKLPIPHCIKNTHGWEVHEDIKNATPFGFADCNFIEKDTFGSYTLLSKIGELYFENDIESIDFMGFCTDICVVSNCLIVRNMFHDTEINVYRNLCAGVTPELHEAALTTMASCQINII